MFFLHMCFWHTDNSLWSKDIVTVLRILPAVYFWQIERTGWILSWWLSLICLSFLFIISDSRQSLMEFHPFVILITFISEIFLLDYPTFVKDTIMPSVYHQDSRNKHQKLSIWWRLALFWKLTSFILGTLSCTL